jgi:hypothetical protein
MTSLIATNDGSNELHRQEELIALLLSIKKQISDN